MPFGTLRVALVTVCTAWLVPAPLAAQHSLADLAAGTRPLERPGTEQEWIVRSVVERMIELAALGKSRPPAPAFVSVATVAASPAVFSVTLSGAAPVTLKVVGHIWDPRTYAPIAAALGVPATPSSTSSGTDTRLIDALTDPSREVLLAEDDRVSAALRAQPRDPSHHDGAAVLLGAMALREGAGMYTDTRPALSRMTAHLAIARAVAPARPPSPAGRLADALLLVEVGREVDALVALVPLEAASQPASMRAWARALRVRATGDWRRVTSPMKSTPLERAAYAKAYAWRVGLGPLLRWMDDVSQPPDLTMTRVLLSQAFPVEVGNAIAPLGVNLEFEEAAALAAAYGATTGDDAPALFRALGAPAPATRFRVLDWPLMASTAERHIVARIKAIYDAEWKLGRRQMLAEMPAKLEKAFAGLPLLPTALALTASDDTARHLSAAASIVRARKDAIPPALWTALVRYGRERAKQVSWPVAETWFNPWEPDGTVLDPDYRIVRQGGEKAPVPQLEAMHAAAPSASYLSWRLAWWRVDGRPPTMAEVRTLSAPVLAYDGGAAYRMFKGLEGSHDDYVQLATSMCELNPDRCIDLGEELLKEGRDREAADELRRYQARARDRVAASLKVLWLTRYLTDQGQVADARRIAEAADDVGSASGIGALAEFLERQGDAAGAEARYKQIQDRYGPSTGWHLGAFYLRRWNATKDPALRDRGLALVAESFPSGLEVPPAAAAAPYDGVAFSNFGARAGRAGLRRSDIIVGIDGVRVRSEGQAEVLLRASHDASIRFTVWRDGAYTTIAGTLPQRWLGCGIKTYRPVAAATP